MRQTPGHSYPAIFSAIFAAFCILAATYTENFSTPVKASSAPIQDSAKDQSRASAKKLVAEAEQLVAVKTAEAQKQALEKFQEALTLWRTAEDLKNEASTLGSIGAIYKDTGDIKKALEASERALQIFQNLGDRAGEAEMLIRVGTIHYEGEDAGKALDYLNRALAVLKQSPDQTLEAAALNNIGNIYDALGEPRRAMEYLNRSLAIKRAVGDQMGQAYALANIGSVHDNIGESRAALEYYTQALPFFRDAKDLRSEAIILNNIAAAWSSLEEIPKALEHYSQALPLYRIVGDRRSEGMALSNIASNYYKLGENDRALEEYNKALALFKALQDRVGEARVLERMALLYNTAVEEQKAIEVYNRLLEIWRAIKDKRSEGTILLRIGNSHFAQKNYAQALEYFTQSLAIARAVENRGDEAEVLQKMGALYGATGKLEQSAEAYQQALEVYRKTGIRDREPMALYGSARTEILRGNLETARKQIESAIEMAESLRGKFSSPALRVSLLADRKKHYETYVDVLMRLHELEPNQEYDARALQTQELARARGLLDLLNETRADIRQGGDAVLLARERKLQQQLNEKELYRMSLLRSKDKEKQLAEVEQELNTLLSEHSETQAEIRAKSPQYAALTQPKPLSLSEIQTQILDPDTVLLEYALGDERSYMWYVTENSRATFVLPRRDAIESFARRFYESMLANDQTNYAETAIALGKILIGPVTDRLANKRLLVVSDGALQYVPFGALHKPPVSGEISNINSGNVSTSTRYRPLILDHEVVNMPSASSLSFLRNKSNEHRPAMKDVAVLADPVFSRDDPRLSISSGKAADSHAVIKADTPEKSQSASAVKRSARDFGLGDFTRLRFSRREAEAIMSLVPKESSLQALDFTASRAMAQSAELGQYRILHFATHGLLNSKRPELSGLVFSLVDQHGEPQDGFLRFHEIYNLKLSASLVVLSACQTALGKEVRGEGLIALTRGFMYAGVPRVVASLWQVDDRATAELMKRFYQGMLKEELRPAAALRAAQVSMFKEKRWKAPHYWAAFTIQGEWR